MLTSSSNSSNIRPQDDLFHAVNTSWLQQATIPAEESGWSNFHVLNRRIQKQLRNIITELEARDDISPGSIEQKVRDYFLAAMDTVLAETNGKVELKKKLVEIELCSTKSELFIVLSKLQLNASNALFTHYVNVDNYDSSIYSFNLYQSGLSLPNREYYDLKNDDMVKLQKQLMKHIPAMFKKIGVYHDSNSVANDVLLVESQLAAVSMSAIELRDVDANYNVYSHSQLQKLSPNLDWKSYFAALGIEMPKKIIVNQPKFIAEVSQIWNKSDLAVLKNYLAWRVILRAAPMLGDEIATLNFSFFGNKLRGIKSIKPQWKRAIDATDSALGDALGKLYVARHFPPEAKAKVEIMVADITSAFKNRLQQLTWMKPETIKFAIKKLDKTYLQIGYPDKFITYDEVDINPNCYLQNYYRSKAYIAKRELAKLGQPVDRGDWFMSPPTVNAYFEPSMNSITFPAGILQPPFFDFEASDAENYGAIGVVIGHELTHGFDDNGSLFDGEGNRNNWFSDSERNDFNQRATLLIELADKFEALPGHFMQGQLTLGENIADIGGVAISYDAYALALKRSTSDVKVGYSPPEQQFFISYAQMWRRKVRPELAIEHLLNDPHAPSEFRVNNSVSNVAGFYQAFKVKPGDGHYLPPELRVDIW